MYHSPFRQDDTPSLKVDYGVNLWCDFGTGEGGSLIDIVMKQHSCNAYGAISRLEQGYYSANTFSFQGKSISERNAVKEEKKQLASPIEIRKIQPLQNPALINYLKSRNIAPEVVSDYVQEMYYCVNGKPLLRSLSRTMQEGTNYAIPATRAAPLPKTLHAYSLQEKGTMPVSCSRDLWTIFLS